MAELGRVLSVSGRVLPSTLHDVRLVADVESSDSDKEIRVKGESRIPESHGMVRRVWLDPNSPQAFPKALQAILHADMIVIGPGSLYTSILPNLLVPDIAAAIRASRGFKVYVCNVATEHGETDGYTCGDHVRALIDHVGDDLFDVVVSNKNYLGELPESIQWVETENELEMELPVYRSDLIDPERFWRHDSGKLAQVLMDLLQERTGPLVE